GTEAGKDLATLQAELDTYANEYQFGVRVGGGRTSDPVTSEAMRIAKDKIRDFLKGKGVKTKDLDATVISAKAKLLLEKDPSIMELAKRLVSEKQAAASDALASIMDAA
ncbi:MAG TPA: hypothetical protein VFV92_03285, partial [Candidatus Bathyarchaeia archaeon]|nr:hypothetical protein [Candidatus Bathyarchaeia archaeon]